MCPSQAPPVPDKINFPCEWNRVHNGACFGRGVGEVQETLELGEIRAKAAAAISNPEPLS